MCDIIYLLAEEACNLIEFRMSHCPMTPDIYMALSSLVSENCMRRLIFFDCIFSEPGLHVLTDEIRMNHGLRLVSFGLCAFSSSHEALLSDMIEGNKCLQKVDLYHASFMSSGSNWTKILDALKVNTTLELIDLPHIDPDVDGWEDLVCNDSLIGIEDCDEHWIFRKIK